MSTDIVTTLYTDYVKPFQTHLVVMFVVIIFTLASYMAYNWYIKPTVENLNGHGTTFHLKKQIISHVSR